MAAKWEGNREFGQGENRIALGSLGRVGSLFRHAASPAAIAFRSDTGGFSVRHSQRWTVFWAPGTNCQPVPRQRGHQGRRFFCLVSGGVLRYAAFVRDARKAAPFNVRPAALITTRRRLFLGGHGFRGRLGTATGELHGFHVFPWNGRRARESQARRRLARRMTRLTSLFPIARAALTAGATNRLLFAVLHPFVVAVFAN